MGVPVGEMFLHRSIVSYFLLGGGRGMIVGTSFFGGDFCWRAKRETPVRIGPPRLGCNWDNTAEMHARRAQPRLGGI